MTTTQYVQAIDEAYQAYVALFNDIKASREVQEAQFQVYQKLVEAYNTSKKAR